LSNPNEEPIFDKRIFNNQENLSISNLIAFNQNERDDKSKFKAQKEGSKNWQDIVQARIDAKTKIKKVDSLVFKKMS
jgi:hypothetical protein